MRKPLASLLLALAGSGALVASAETLVVDDQVMVRPTTLQVPARGATMAAVEAHFGAPQARHDAVGAPPITRWDYPTFSVFFEHDRVVDTVVTGS